MLSILCLRKSPADTPIINWRFQAINPGFNHIIEVMSVYDLPINEPPRSSISGTEVSLFREMNLDFVGQINYGLEHCKGDWVYISSDDEMPPVKILCDFENLMKVAAPYEVVAFPRMNLFPWQGDIPMFWPDYQSRLVRNRIRFKGGLHEMVDCCKDKILKLEQSPENIIYHVKSHEMQKASDDLYSKLAQ